MEFCHEKIRRCWLIRKRNVLIPGSQGIDGTTPGHYWMPRSETSVSISPVAPLAANSAAV